MARGDTQAAPDAPSAASAWVEAVPSDAPPSDSHLRERLRETGRAVAVVRELETSQHAPSSGEAAPSYELCIVAYDRPRIYRALVSLVAELGLSVDEAHGVCSGGIVNNTFVTSGWTGTAEELRAQLAQRLEVMEAALGEPRGAEQPSPLPPSRRSSLDISTSPTDWEIDASQLSFGPLLASGAGGEVYRGTFVGGEVAIKVLAGGDRRSKEDADVQQFLHELAVMRRVRHRHIVQLIGACTRTPHQLCIVTEFCSGGSLLARLRRPPAPPPLERVSYALQVARGLDYLHRCGVIHRDVKAANILLTEHGDCKVADFGVSRLADARGEMTAETGTYRWMAPEVFAHQLYDRKCDVFSFAVMLWEIESGGRVPHEGLTPLQVALGVVEQGLRPEVPRGAQPGMARLMAACWEGRPEERPEFSWVVERLAEEVAAVQGGGGGGASAAAEDAVTEAEERGAEARCGIISGCGLGRLFRRAK